MITAALGYLIGDYLDIIPWLQILVNLTVALIYYIFYLFFTQKILLLKLLSVVRR